MLQQAKASLNGAELRSTAVVKNAPDVKITRVVENAGVVLDHTPPDVCDSKQARALH